MEVAAIGIKNYGALRIRKKKNVDEIIKIVLLIINLN